MTVALYVRVSTQEQTEGYSVGEQSERLQNYCKAMKWSIHKIYVDGGYSGANMDRPALRELIADVEKGMIEKVVVYKLDRLSRSQLDTLYLIEKVFLVNSVDFVSLSESFDTSSSFGRAMIGTLAVFSQLEREQIRDRMTMGKEARAKEGKWGGSYSPIGYTYDVNSERLEVNEYEAMQVKEAFELLLNGVPIGRIASIFDKKGYTYNGRSHGSGSRWDIKRLRYVFQNRLYVGYIRHRDTWYEASHTPIINEETFEKAQKIIEAQKEKVANNTNRRTDQRSLLGGLLYCKQCGTKYLWRKGSKKYPHSVEPPRYYSCYSRTKSVPKMVRDPNCKNKTWRADVLEELILDQIKNIKSDPLFFENMKNEKIQNTDIDKIEILNQEIKKLDAQISRFMDLYGIGQFTIDQVSEKVNSLNERRSQLIDERDAQKVVTELDEEETLEMVTTFEEAIERGDFVQVRHIVHSLIDYIDIDDEDVYIHWRFA